MRVEPRPLISVGLAAGYLVIIVIVWAVVGLDFTTIGFSEAAADAGSPFGAFNFSQWGAFGFAVIGVVLVLRCGDHRYDARQDTLVPN